VESEDHGLFLKTWIMLKASWGRKVMYLIWRHGSWRHGSWRHGSWRRGSASAPSLVEFSPSN